LALPANVIFEDFVPKQLLAAERQKIKPNNRHGKAWEVSLKTYKLWQLSIENHRLYKKVVFIKVIGN
jgi:hypothetical protein